MKITKDTLKQLIKEELNNLAEQVKPSQWLEENYVKPYLDEGYKRYDALPRDHGLVAGKTYPAVHSACAITFKDHDIVLVLDGDFSCIRGRMDVMWRVDEKEFNKLVGTEDVYAVLAKTSSTPKADLADPLEEMIREELGTMLTEDKVLADLKRNLKKYLERLANEKDPDRKAQHEKTIKRLRQKISLREKR